jgi:hypothetical protein
VAESKGLTGAGIQYTDKGPTQGITLVGSDGKPFTVVVDADGKHRLAVDAALTLEGITVDLSSNTDSIAIGNASGDDQLFVEGDGSISTRVLDGAGNAITSGTRTGNVRALDVEVVDNGPGMVPGTTKVYDLIELSYDGSHNLTGVIYKNGGAVVTTLVLAYSGDDLISVTRT